MGVSHTVSVLGRVRGGGICYTAIAVSVGVVGAVAFCKGRCAVFVQKNKNKGPMWAVRKKYI